MSVLATQLAVCDRMSVDPCPTSEGDNVGLARAARSGLPIHGMRVPPTKGMSGWFIWAGELSEQENFFEPVHAVHLREICPLAQPFLALPAGWRFLTDGSYVDVWHDPQLLEGVE